MNENWRSALRAGAGAALLLVLVPACASRGRSELTGTNSGKVFAVTADKTAFYRYGPQQGNGADQELPKDTLVTLIRPSFGYSKVQLVSGADQGYVASEDIKPAPPTLLAALNVPPPLDGGVAPSSESFDTNTSEPPPPEALPDPDLPPESTVPLP